MAEQPGEWGRVFVAATTSPARPAQVFDCLESFLTFQPLDNIAESIGEPAHVVVQRNVFRAGVGFDRNGGDVGIVCGRFQSRV